MKNAIMESTETIDTAISAKALLAHWQGHRRVTRRMISAFPDDKFFTHSIGGMRTFAELIKEILGMAVPTLQGAITGKWQSMGELPQPASNTKEAFLRHWDETTEQINALWGQISTERFQETDLAFGQWEMRIYELILYIIDNEIHHRGQGYVYLRSLGVEPPPFWDRN